MKTGKVKLLLTLDWPSLIEVAGKADGYETVITTDKQEILEHIADTEVAAIVELDAEYLSVAKKLRWIQVFTGGVEGYLVPELCHSDIKLSSLKGMFGSVAAEHTLAHMFAFARKLNYDLLRRSSRNYDVYEEATELAGKTLGIIGLGNIGRALAQKANCLGMRVIGLARSQRDCPDGVEKLYEKNQILELVGQSDYLAVAVPNTAQTKGMVGEDILKAMKPSAYLIDISGRAAVYDLDAVTKALEEESIAGASFQVKMPEDSVLWDMDNFIYAFHRTTSKEMLDRIAGVFAENLRRYLNDQPLLGLVDKKLGY